MKLKHLLTYIAFCLVIIHCSDSNKPLICKGKCDDALTACFIVSASSPKDSQVEFTTNCLRYHTFCRLNCGSNSSNKNELDRQWTKERNKEKNSDRQ